MRVEMDEVDVVAETSLTIRGPRRRTTVPKEIVDRLALRDGDRVRWMLFHDGRVVVVKVRLPRRSP
jgi:bifunctional DNA-binding transcriptional regulator/antitoxin component of YhaV-PrlF toxin-antitoxin module